MKESSNREVSNSWAIVSLCIVIMIMTLFNSLGSPSVLTLFVGAVFAFLGMVGFNDFRRREKAYEEAEELIDEIKERIQKLSIQYTLNKEDDRVVSITCHECNMTSHNQGDIDNLYCGNCHKFHSNLV